LQAVDVLAVGDERHVRLLEASFMASLVLTTAGAPTNLPAARRVA
jgi:hypothetical protein